MNTILVCLSILIVEINKYYTASSSLQSAAVCHHVYVSDLDLSMKSFFTQIEIFMKT